MNQFTLVVIGLAFTQLIDYFRAGRPDLPIPDASLPLWLPVLPGTVQGNPSPTA